ncbi:hypothetical protein D3C80_1670590 [compost metagenome]
MAVASSSDSMDLAVPGSPTNIRPRPVASVTSIRSIEATSATILRSMPNFSSPRIKRRAAFRLSAQPGGRGWLSNSANRASCSAY